MRAVWLWVLAAVSCGVPVGAACAQHETLAQNVVLTIDPTSEPSRHIQLSAVRRMKLSDKIAATATVEADAGALAQITTRIPASVIKLVAQPGQSVKPGQPLAILSSLELGDAAAEYLKTRSLEAITNQNLKREEDLYAKHISPLKDVLTMRAAHDTALAQYEASREKLTLLIPPDELARLNWSSNDRSLSDFPLTSPISGTLIRRDLVLGEAVASDRPLMTVINLDKVWVNANIYESDLATVRIGNRAAVSVVAYPHRKFEGRVFYVSDEVDRKTRTVLARIEVPNPDHLLKPGMFAHTLIEDSDISHEVLIVPESAVFDYQDGKLVFVAAGPSRYETRSVDVGGQSEDNVEIVAGLSEGEQVVITGGLALKTLLINKRYH